jgi:hypothetical protein
MPYHSKLYNTGTLLLKVLVCYPKGRIIVASGSLLVLPRAAADTGSILQYAALHRSSTCSCSSKEVRRRGGERRGGGTRARERGKGRKSSLGLLVVGGTGVYDRGGEAEGGSELRAA